MNHLTGVALAERSQEQPYKKLFGLNFDKDEHLELQRIHNELRVLAVHDPHLQCSRNLQNYIKNQNSRIQLVGIRLQRDLALLGEQFDHALSNPAETNNELYTTVQGLRSRQCILGAQQRYLDKQKEYVRFLKYNIDIKARRVYLDTQMSEPLIVRPCHLDDPFQDPSDKPRDHRSGQQFTMPSFQDDQPTWGGNDTSMNDRDIQGWDVGGRSGEQLDQNIQDRLESGQEVCDQDDTLNAKEPQNNWEPPDGNEHGNGWDTTSHNATSKNHHEGSYWDQDSDWNMDAPKAQSLSWDQRETFSHEVEPKHDDSFDHSRRRQVSAVKTRGQELQPLVFRRRWPDGTDARLGGRPRRPSSQQLHVNDLIGYDRASPMATLGSRDSDLLTEPHVHSHEKPSLDPIEQRAQELGSLPQSRSSKSNSLSQATTLVPSPAEGLSLVDVRVAAATPVKAEVISAQGSSIQSLDFLVSNHLPLKRDSQPRLECKKLPSQPRKLPAEQMPLALAEARRSSLTPSIPCPNTYIPPNEDVIDKIFTSEKDRLSAIRTQLGANDPYFQSLPLVFRHGIQYCPVITGHSSADEQSPSYECRRVVVSNLPDVIRTRDVLAQVRGGMILHATLAGNPATRNSGSVALLDFVCWQEAHEYVKFARSHPISVRGRQWRIALARLPSYPMSPHLSTKLLSGHTRHIVVRHFPFAGILDFLNSLHQWFRFTRHIQEKFEDIWLSEQGDLHLLFNNISDSSRIYDLLGRIRQYAEFQNRVEFEADPCEGALVELQQPMCLSRREHISHLDIWYDQDTAGGNSAEKEETTANKTSNGGSNVRKRSEEQPQMLDAHRRVTEIEADMVVAKSNIGVTKVEGQKTTEPRAHLLKGHLNDNDTVATQDTPSEHSSHKEWNRDGKVWPLEDFNQQYLIELWKKDKTYWAMNLQGLQQSDCSDNHGSSADSNHTLVSGATSFLRQEDDSGNASELIQAGLNGLNMRANEVSNRDLENALPAGISSSDSVQKGKQPSYTGLEDTDALVLKSHLPQNDSRYMELMDRDITDPFVRKSEIEMAVELGSDTSGALEGQGEPMSLAQFRERYFPLVQQFNARKDESRGKDLEVDILYPPNGQSFDQLPKLPPGVSWPRFNSSPDWKERWYEVLKQATEFEASISQDVNRALTTD